MRFQSTVVSAVAVFASCAYAQDKSQVKALISDIDAYVASLTANPAALASLLAGVPGTALIELEAFATELSGLVTQKPGQVSSAINALPTEVRSFASSVVKDVDSIISKDIGTSTSGLAALETSLAAIESGISSITISGVAATTGSASGSATGSATSSSGKAKATGNGATRDAIGMGLLGGSLMAIMGFMIAL